MLFNDYWNGPIFFFNILKILKIEKDKKGRGPFIFKHTHHLKDQIAKISGLKVNTQP